MSAVPETIGQKNGNRLIRFSDFASVVTSIGTCWEPFNINLIATASGGFPTDIDYKDEMQRIDSIDSIGPKSESRLLADDNGRVLHKLDKWPRLNL